MTDGACRGTMDPGSFLRSLFDIAVAAVHPDRVLPPHLPEPPQGRTVVLAFGKAATAMADAAAAHWPSPLTGLAVTRYGHALPGFPRRGNLELIEAGHPVPDRMSVAGARRALELARELGQDDLALVLVSGGGSALLCLPMPGLSLEDKQRITSELLRAGASIRELNTVRKALSQVKGGRLAEAAAPARVDTLIISDVVGDDPAMIASGPTVPRRETLGEVQAILRRYRIELPPGVLDTLMTESPSSPLRGDNRCRVVASSADALAAAAAAARDAGVAVRLLGDAIEGDAREAAAPHAALAKETAQSAKPTVVLSGGELTTTVRNANGIGGPNTEFLLALAIELEGAAGIHAIACDTDGYDGAGRHAGALAGPRTLVRAEAAGIDPAQALDASDSGRFFEALGDLVITGPTQTNVSDFRAILVGGP
ncbi:MAG TPA: glycerate kinase [Woeseiaceae bacterium]|nr:glycerate kinase [Woeseiaceae bacterium]